MMIAYSIIAAENHESHEYNCSRLWLHEPRQSRFCVMHPENQFLPLQLGGLSTNLAFFSSTYLPDHHRLLTAAARDRPSSISTHGRTEGQEMSCKPFDLIDIRPRL